MKRNKILVFLTVAAVSAISVHNVHKAQQEKELLSDVTLENLEALADAELPSNPSCVAVWDKECCFCGTVHHTYARYAGNITVDPFCVTRTDCSHFQ